MQTSPIEQEEKDADSAQSVASPVRWWRSWWRSLSPTRQDRYAALAPLASVLMFTAAIIASFWYLRTEEVDREQEALRRDEAAMFVVSDTTVRYLRPARLDDEVVVTVRLAESGKASLVIDQQALRGGEVLAEGRIRIGCVDAQTLRPRRIPPNLLASIGPA